MRGEADGRDCRPVLGVCQDEKGKDAENGRATETGDVRIAPCGTKARPVLLTLDPPSFFIVQLRIYVCKRQFMTCLLHFLLSSASNIPPHQMAESGRH